MTEEMFDLPDEKDGKKLETELDNDMLALLRGEKKAEENEEEPEYKKYLVSEEGTIDEEETSSEESDTSDNDESDDEEFTSLYPSDEYVMKTTFTSRLHQSSDDVKKWYSSIKNKILAYKKVKSKVSSDYDSFRTGRDAIVKINVRGKTLSIYFALEPSVIEPKYHTKDVSSKKKFSAVPVLLKVKSERAFKYACELLLRVAENEKLVVNEKAEEKDYTVPYFTTSELVSKGLIKPLAKPKFLYGKGFPLTTDVNDDVKTMDSLFDTESEYDDDEEEHASVNEDGKPIPTAKKNNVVMVPDATGEKPLRIEYSRSYMARLIQTEDSIKEYYNKVKQAVLSYKNVKQTVSWKYESFNKGRTQCAKINIKGKSLYVYLAKEAIEENEKKRSGIKLVKQKQFAKVPVLIKVRDEKTLAKVLSRIELMMSKLGISGKDSPCTDDFRLPYESTTVLIEKGLIKMRIEGGKVELTEEYIQQLNVGGQLEKIIEKNNSIYDQKQEEIEKIEDHIDDTRFGDFSRDLKEMTRTLAEEYDFFPTVLSVLRNGDATISLKKRIMLRAIDETWVRAVEDSLSALDLVTRRPSKFIEEREELVPIELSRNISSRSIVHLSQHTNLISRIEGDTITPSKILNVFRDETMMTYENKFVNTLIFNLYIFVNKRYEIALKDGADEKQTIIDFNEKFTHGDMRGKISLKIELDEPLKETDEVDKNYTYTSGIWERVERINNVCQALMGSDFVKAMGQTYIRPPVIRTNAILKNRELKQCLNLWEFISAFDETGYELVVKESLETLDEAYIQQLYYAVATQYILFRHRMNSDFEADELDAKSIDTPFKPRIIDELEEIDKSQFDVKQKISIPTPPKEVKNDFVEALGIALEADRRMKIDRGGK